MSGHPGARPARRKCPATARSPSAHSDGGHHYKDARDLGRQVLERVRKPFEVNIFDPAAVDLGLKLGGKWRPETFLVDADGIVRYKHVGYITPAQVDEV